MRETSHAIAVLTVLGFLGAAMADNKINARVHKAFTVAWQAKHDTKTDGDRLAEKLYREAWLGFSPYSVRFELAMASKNELYPDDASAESIISGEHGDASTWRLWELTNDICYDFFTKHCEIIIKTMISDIQGDLDARRRVSQVLSEWQRYILFHQHHEGIGPYVIEDSDYKEEWNRIVRELYPAAAKRFKELKEPDPYGNEPLAYILRRPERSPGDTRAFGQGWQWHRIL